MIPDDVMMRTAKALLEMADRANTARGASWEHGAMCATHLTTAVELLGELRRLRAVCGAARDVVSAADACDREAERHPSSRSSAPVVRSINAMNALRDAISGTDGGPR